MCNFILVLEWHLDRCLVGVLGVLDDLFVEYRALARTCIHASLHAYLDPVAIRISDKCNVFHFTVLKSLDKVNLELLETFASSVNIIDEHCNVTETASGFLVAVGVLEVFVVLGAPVANCLCEKIICTTTRLVPR